MELAHDKVKTALHKGDIQGAIETLKEAEYLVAERKKTISRLRTASRSVIHSDEQEV